MSYRISQFLMYVLARTNHVLISYVHSEFRDLRYGSFLIAYKTPEQIQIFNSIRALKHRMQFKLAYNEAYQLACLVESTAKVTGSIAEVGCFEGGSTRLIAEHKGTKEFFVFDTFEGLPEVTAVDSTHFKVGMYSAGMMKVMANVGDIPGITYSKGYFPNETGHVVANTSFSLVHLDLDTYQSTKGCLEFFYPRMSAGGVIISHDYVSAAGVRKAFDEFFVDKKEPLIEASGSQVIVQKI